MFVAAALRGCSGSAGLFHKEKRRVVQTGRRAALSRPSVHRRPTLRFRRQREEGQDGRRQSHCKQLRKQRRGRQRRWDRGGSYGCDGLSGITRILTMSFAVIRNLAWHLSTKDTCTQEEISFTSIQGLLLIVFLLQCSLIIEFDL